MVDPQLQRLLVCPACHGELAFQDRAITCQNCGVRYPVEGQIPVMTVGVSNDGFGHDLYHAQLHGNFFEKVFHTNRIQTLTRLITCELSIEPGGQVLDVGCNTGPMLIPLRRRGFDIVGIGTRLPFRDHSFDLILLVDILEHTDDPQRVVSEVKRLLVPGGIVIATVPWAYHPYVRFTWIRKLLSSRKTIDEHPDAPFKFEMLQSLFPGFEPLLFRLVFHWVCVLGVYRLPAVEGMDPLPERTETTLLAEDTAPLEAAKELALR
jgi:SAM-dependent methyltransferase